MSAEKTERSLSEKYGFLRVTLVLFAACSRTLIDWKKRSI
jgi:hypothetical protein